MGSSRTLSSAARIRLHQATQRRAKFLSTRSTMSAANGSAGRRSRTQASCLISQETPKPPPRTAKRGIRLPPPPLPSEDGQLPLALGTPRQDACVRRTRAVGTQCQRTLVLLGAANLATAVAVRLPLRGAISPSCVETVRAVLVLRLAHALCGVSRVFECHSLSLWGKK